MAPFTLCLGRCKGGVMTGLGNHNIVGSWFKRGSRVSPVRGLHICPSLCLHLGLILRGVWRIIQKIQSSKTDMWAYSPCTAPTLALLVLCCEISWAWASPARLSSPAEAHSALTKGSGPKQASEPKGLWEAFLFLISADGFFRRKNHLDRREDEWADEPAAMLPWPCYVKGKTCCNLRPDVSRFEVKHILINDSAF